MDWRIWKDWPWWVKVIAVIWMLLPLPHLYEILKIWLPWIHSLLDEIGFRLPTPSQEEENQSLFDQVRTSMLVVAAWYGVFFLIWRTILADRQTRSTEMQALSVETQTQINRENHYTDLFTKAVEQLGATRQDGEPALETRIGAIFALERLAKDSERDYGPIIETLAAYIREHCRDPKAFDDKDLSGKELEQARKKWIQSLRENPPADRSDVAAALTVLSRREKNRNWASTGEDETQPDFTGANFQGATLWNKNEGLAREDMNLGLAHFEGANLGGVDLSYANLWVADLSSLDIWVTNFMGANLEGANLSGTNLLGANLSHAYLREANLWDTDLGGANLSYANLSNAELSGANLRGANLSHTDLSESDLSGAELWEANLSRANLSGANPWGANLSGANLRRADLSGSELSRVNLSGADLRGAYLSGVELLEAELEGANLTGANLRGVLLAGAQLKGSRGLTDEILEKAFGDGDTYLPDGLTRPVHWGSREDAVKQHRAFLLNRLNDLPF
ncbi:MAG: pentapeptide repeat-containing protein [Candidatus Latescibacteria bacterium]|nr:pentapeptide repeat-containing protein [Candidatus Latescibacterota bacterium]